MEREFDIQNIKLIVGLGNIGKNYTYTRHNAGFLFIDKLVEALGLKELTEASKFNSITSVNTIASSISVNSKLILAKPATLMNRSGEAVLLLMQYYKINPEEIIVAHDDLDIQLGSYKLQFGKGPKVHNGIISIEEQLNTDQFWRLRLGIDNRTAEERANIPGQSYVLANFPLAERVLLDSIIQVAINDMHFQT